MTYEEKAWAIAHAFCCTTQTLFDRIALINKEVSIMNKSKQTDAQINYKKFDKASKIITTLILLVGLAALTSLLISMIYIGDNLIPVLVSVAALAVWFVVLCAVASKLNSKRLILYEAAYGKEKDIVRTGLFGEIWEEFEWNQFEGLTDGKIVFAETHNNTIELEIIRHKHEFNITIDSEAVYMVMDDETDNPVEKEMPLSKIIDVGQVFTIIREFVESV